MTLPTAPGSSPAFAAALDAMKGQLLIVLVNRLGGNIDIPVGEIDDTGGWMMHAAIDAATGTLNFSTTRKS